jgi:hypothetical protein
MISQTPGKGGKYMIAFTDGDGISLSGDCNYRLHLPANHSGRPLLVGNPL